MITCIKYFKDDIIINLHNHKFAYASVDYQHFKINIARDAYKLFFFCSEKLKRKSPSTHRIAFTNYIMELKFSGWRILMFIPQSSQKKI